MQQQNIISKSFLIILVISAVITITIRITNSFNSDTKIVFCNVGQGDASYIRIRNKIDLLIDAGPDRSILNCLGKYMPFNDTSIELAIISHAHKDHFYGFLPVLERYSINTLYMSPFTSDDPQFMTLMNKLKSKKSKLGHLRDGRNINIGSTTIKVYWPTQSYLESVQSNKEYPINNPKIDPNDTSLIFSYIEGAGRILYTGDAPQTTLEEVVNEKNILSSVLKISHHGSKTGTSENLINSIRPSLGIISVGKNNFYHHPAIEVLNLLRSKKTKILRTDRDGDVVLKISDGKLYLK